MKGLLAALVLCAGACAAAPRPVAPVLCARLAGAGPNSDATDPVHRGEARIVLTRNGIRYEISAPEIGIPIATHIHHGGEGVNGPMLWELNPGFRGDSVRDTAAEVPPGLIRLIAADPGDYYLKIHTAAFPGGAIRGQLTPCQGPASSQTRTSSR